MNVFLLIVSFITLVLGIMLWFKKGKLKIAAPWIINNACFVYVVIAQPGFAVSLLYLAIGIYLVFHYLTHFRLNIFCWFLIALCVVEVIITNFINWDLHGVNITLIKTNILLVFFIPIFFQLPILLSNLKLIMFDNHKEINFAFYNFITGYLYTFFFIGIFSISSTFIHMWVTSISNVEEFLLISILASSLYAFYLGYFKYSNQFKTAVIRTDVSNLSTVEDKAVGEIKRLHKIDDVVNQNQLFLISDLTLPSLAERLKIHPKLLSGLINQYYEISFHGYINKKRIEFAKERLFDPEFENFTIVAIGSESGFSSRSTFYSTFKKFVGCTPTEYKKKMSRKMVLT